MFTSLDPDLEPINSFHSYMYFLEYKLLHYISIFLCNINVYACLVVEYDIIVLDLM
jgi:hypothetical protein